MPDRKKLVLENKGIERKINLRDAFPYFKCPTTPNLLCIGSPGLQKSTLLNDMLGVQFEVMSDGMAGIFHDSVDALYTCAENPMGFNVFDFQGEMANKDLHFLKLMLRNMPNVFLLVQTNDPDYIDNMIGQLAEDIRSKLSKRIFVVTKIADKRKGLKCKKSLRSLCQGFEDAT